MYIYISVWYHQSVDQSGTTVRRQKPLEIVCQRPLHNLYAATLIYILAKKLPAPTALVTASPCRQPSGPLLLGTLLNLYAPPICMI